MVDLGGVFLLACLRGGEGGPQKYMCVCVWMLRETIRFLKIYNKFIINFKINLFIYYLRLISKGIFFLDLPKEPYTQWMHTHTHMCHNISHMCKISFLCVYMKKVFFLILILFLFFCVSILFIYNIQSKAKFIWVCVCVPF